MKKRKVFYYSKDMQDDFGGVGVNHKPLKKGFVYIHKNIFYRFCSWCLFYLLAKPILTIYSRLFMGVKVEGKKNLKGLMKSKEGFLIYSNHVHMLDAFLLHIYVGFPKRTYIISHSDPINIPVVGKLVMLLGCLPLPTDLHDYRNFENAIKQRLDEGSCIAIYPEGTVWPYYANGTRPMKKTSFKYAASNNKPIVVVSETFKKRKVFKNAKPRMVIKISAPIYPEEHLSINENMENLYNKAMEIWNNTLLDGNNYSYYEYKLKEENEVKQK